jgi:hypothetical protein
VKSTNNQLQADKYAAEGFLVVMPDQYVEMNSISQQANIFTDSVAIRLPARLQNPSPLQMKTTIHGIQSRT